MMGAQIWGNSIEEKSVPIPERNQWNCPSLLIPSNEMREIIKAMTSMIRRNKQCSNDGITECMNTCKYRK